MIVHRNIIEDNVPTFHSIMNEVVMNTNVLHPSMKGWIGGKSNCALVIDDVTTVPQAQILPPRVRLGLSLQAGPSVTSA